MATDPLTELSDLRLFLQEKIQEFDSSIDTSTGSTFDTLVISPLIDRMSPDPYNVPIRDFILGRLSREFPNLVLQDGEPIDDYAVKIMQVLLEAYRRQIRQVSTNQSLANPEQLNEREADNLAGNFFVRRRMGGYAVGVARLYYSSPQYALVTPSNAVYDGSGHRFFPVESQAISSDSMLFNEENGLFYFDIVVRAEKQGKDYNIEFNTLTGIEGVPSCVKVTNKRAFDEGDTKEDTTTFIERVENSLTEKSLVTLRGIRARLFDTFDNIQLIQPIGHGDPEMKRDILKGSSESAPYASGMGRTPNTGGAGTKLLDISGDFPLLLTDGSTSAVFTGYVTVGDRILVKDLGGSAVAYDRVVEAVVSPTRLALNDTIPDNLTTVMIGGTTCPAAQFSLMKPNSTITLSDIPGGILIPTTPAGNIEVVSGEVHIGGALDVFVRAGAPQQRDITLTGVLDGAPLHFGLDLESFGDAPNQRVHITEKLVNRASIPAEDKFGSSISPLDQIVVEIVQGTDFSSDGTQPWVPTAQDEGRYIQLLGGNAPGDGGPDFGTFKIKEVMGKEYFKDDAGRWHLVVRVRIYTDKNYEDGSTTLPFLHHTTSGSGQGVFDLSVRLLEELTIKDRVRDRDNSTTVIPENSPFGYTGPAIMGGVDFDGIGTSVGDSVVVETGDDAGIYSIRRVLSWLGTNDTLILDRELTRSVTPSGGTGTGLRYRIADELNVDLVAPKVTKIPLGDIFLGDDLSTVAGSNQVSVSGSTNFLLAGAEQGDTLEILEGDNAGKYGIQEVTGTTATLDAPVLSTTFSQKFMVYKAFTGVTRPLVRVKSVELLDSNSQPTGIKIPYGSPIDARVISTLSNQSEGNIVESYTGELQDNGVGMYDLQDTLVDFSAEGVTTEHRLRVMNGASINGYTIVAVGLAGGLPSNHHIRVALESDGGVEFRSPETNIHYLVGLPSSGYLRLYFLEPTSVELSTGLKGGRVKFEESGTTKEFRFSPVPGYSVLPSGGSGEDTPQDLRMVRNWSSGGGNFFSIVELTDLSKPNVFQLELDEGDTLVEVNEQLQFRALTTLSGTWTWPGGTGLTGTVVASSVSGIKVGMYIAAVSGHVFEVTAITGAGPYNVTISNPSGVTMPSGPQATERIATLEQLGVFGKAAGLRTVAGSNLVTVPTNSLINFDAMNRVYPLTGQVLIIDSGSDTGRYTVEEVVGSKTLRLNKVMTTTTAAVLGGDTGSPSRDAVLSDSGTKSRITDVVDGGQLKTNNFPGYFINIFESVRPDFDGAWEVTDLLTSPSVANTIEIDTKDSLTNEGSTFASLDPYAIGLFSWVKTDTDKQVEQTFKVYRDVPTELQVVEVATKRLDVTSGVRRATITTDGGLKVKLVDADSAFTMNAKRGDLLEILSGVNAGVYVLKEDSTGGTAKIHAYPEFAVTMSDVPYRVWGGLHGSTRMMTLGPKDSFNGKLPAGDSMPYRIRKSGVERVGSTVMESNFDGLLYYVDVQIESQGAGDDMNLATDTRMTVVSGVKVDGYTYSVGNNTLTFSTLEEVSLNFDRRFLPVGNSDSPENLTEVSGRNIQITYETSTPVRLVDDLMRSDADRPINASPLARHFLPSFVFTNFVYAGGVSESEVGKDMEDYINKLGSQSELEVSDLETFITKRGATYVRHPISLVTVTHDLDRALIVDRSFDKLGGLSSVPFNGTGRIACFFAKVGEGITLVRES